MVQKQDIVAKYALLEVAAMPAMGIGCVKKVELAPGEIPHGRFNGIDSIWLRSLNEG